MKPLRLGNYTAKAVLLSGLIILLAACNRNPAGEEVTYYRHDDSMDLMRRNSTGPKKEDFSEILIFETISQGMDTQIYANELKLSTAIYRSRDSKTIGDFIELAQRDNAEYVPAAIEDKGKTYHIVLRLNNSTEAYFLRVFVDANERRAIFRAGIDPSVIRRNDGFINWIKAKINK